MLPSDTVCSQRIAKCTLVSGICNFLSRALSRSLSLCLSICLCACLPVSPPVCVLLSVFEPASPPARHPASQTDRQTCMIYRCQASQTFLSSLSPWSRSGNLLKHARNVCVSGLHVCVCTSACMHARLYVRMHLCMHVGKYMV